MFQCRFSIIANDLDRRKKWRFAEQFQSAVLGISNNMAEGSGGVSDNDFAYFLNIARWSIFKVASMLVVFHRSNLIPERPKDLLAELVELSKMTQAFRNTLKNR